MMTLSKKQIKYLRKLGHELSPIVIVADRGLIDTVMEAIEEALDVHELVKIKVRKERGLRNKVCEEICKKTAAIEVQKMGMVLLIYRPSKKSKIDLSGK